MTSTGDMTNVDHSSLLSCEDPNPVELLNAESDSPILLLCEHAGREIPAVLNGLGVAEYVIDSHRGWDIGAENVARRLANRLHSPLVVQRYSRLVIDSNRPPGGKGSIPTISDGTAIAGSEDMPSWQRQARIDEIFKPLDSAIGAMFACHKRRYAFSIHSFTPRFAGKSRPWHAGFLTRTKTECAKQLMASIQEAAPDAVLALNEPYQIDDETDWFIPVHAEPRDIPHCLIEIRNDQIDTDEGAERWAGLLAEAILSLVKDGS